MTNRDQNPPPADEGQPTAPRGRGHVDPERGRRIADARDAKLLTQEQLAQQIQRSPRRMSQWEAGDTIGAQSLTRLADALDVSTDYLEFGVRNAGEPDDDEPDRLGRIEERLDKLEDVSDKILEAVLDRPDFTREIQIAFEDYARRLGPEIGKLRARSKRDPGHPKADAQAAASDTSPASELP